MNRNRTPGKLLLFGEYTVLLGSTALAMPLPHLNGYWRNGVATAQQDLMPFAEYLRQLSLDQHLLAPIEADHFMQEVKEGLIFESNIPVGYGAGSSGALCAAVYERYAKPATPKNDEKALPVLQQQLAQLEGFFHGQSSGADPLICYLQQPLLFEGKTIRPVEASGWHNRKGCFFLVDTRISRRTAPLVKHFKAKCKDHRFRENAMQFLAKPTTAAVHAYLQNQVEAMEQALLQISIAQLELLTDFIPDQFRSQWSEGLETERFYLKLCGAGGGGFLIGYSPGGQLPQAIPPEILSPLPQV